MQSDAMLMVMVVKLTTAVIADEVEQSASGIGAIGNRIARELRLSRFPSPIALWLVFTFQGPAGRTFRATTEVKSAAGRFLWFESCSVTAPESGEGEHAVPLFFSVPKRGDFSVALFFGPSLVWQQTISVASVQ
jgi:hypothetical protein